MSLCIKPSVYCIVLKSFSDIHKKGLFLYFTEDIGPKESNRNILNDTIYFYQECNHRIKTENLEELIYK